MSSGAPRWARRWGRNGCSSTSKPPCPATSLRIQPQGDSMNDPTEKLTRSAALAAKGNALLQKRVKIAQDRFTARVREIYEKQQKEQVAQPLTPWAFWHSSYEYALDFAQRSVLFRDTLRQRGNAFVEHE